MITTYYYLYADYASRFPWSVASLLLVAACNSIFRSIIELVAFHRETDRRTRSWPGFGQRFLWLPIQKVPTSIYRRSVGTSPGTVVASHKRRVRNRARHWNGRKSRARSKPLSRIRGLTCEILAHAPTPSIPPHAPSLGVAPHLGLPFEIYLFVLPRSSLPSSLLVQLSPRHFTLPPALQRRSSLVVFSRRPILAASSSSVSFGELLNHEATSVWRQGSACAGVKEVFHEVSARVYLDSQLWKWGSILNWSLLYRSVDDRYRVGNL